VSALGFNPGLGFTGREEELAHLCHAVEEEDIAEWLPERALQKNADLSTTMQLALLPHVMYIVMYTLARCHTS
jgi:hypothetical protein